MLELLDLLRVGVQVLGHLAQLLAGQLARVLDHFRILLLLGPLGVGTVDLGQLAQLFDGVLVLVHLAQRVDDPLLPVGRCLVVGIELDQKALALDRPLITRLVVEGIGQPRDHLARIGRAADRRQELERILGTLALVLGEHHHQVVERFALELLEPLAAFLGELVGAQLARAEIEHLLEAARGPVRIAELPVAPRGLEQREIVERRIGILEHLVVALERRLVVAVLVEARLGDRHPRVGAEAALRVILQDRAELRERLGAASLGAQREAVQVAHRIDLAELRILADQLAVQRLRRRQIELRLRRRAALVFATHPVLRAGAQFIRRSRALLDGGVEAPHLRQKVRLGFFPAQLGELEQHLGRLGRRLVLAQVGLDEHDRRLALFGDQRFLGAQQRLDLARHREIAHARAGVELGLLVVAAREHARREREHERERQPDRQRSICSSRTHPTRSLFPAASTLRRRGSGLRCAACRTFPAGSGRRRGPRSGARACASGRPPRRSCRAARGAADRPGGRADRRALGGSARPTRVPTDC